MELKPKSASVRRVGAGKRKNESIAFHFRRRPVERAVVSMRTGLRRIVSRVMRSVIIFIEVAMDVFPVRSGAIPRGMMTVDSMRLSDAVRFDFRMVARCGAASHDDGEVGAWSLRSVVHGRRAVLATGRVSLPVPSGQIDRIEVRVCDEDRKLIFF